MSEAEFFEMIEDALHWYPDTTWVEDAFQFWQDNHAVTPVVIAEARHGSASHPDVYRHRDV